MAKNPGDKGASRDSQFVAGQLGVASARTHWEPVRTSSGRVRYEEHVDELITHDGTRIILTNKKR